VNTKHNDHNAQHVQHDTRPRLHTQFTPPDGRDELRRGRCQLAIRLQRSQWRSKALRGPGSTVTWGPSIPSASPQGLKLEARSAESGGGALGRFVYALYGFLLLVSFSEVAYSFLA